jgi:NodT family efflux transporter outer membrane factor (OMF) lipoprotein
VSANAYQAQASAADIATATLSTQAQLATYYFELRAIDAQRQILHDTEISYQQALQLTETLYKLGIDSEQDVAQARTQLDTATAQERDLGVNRSAYEHAIATLMGVPPANLSISVSPFNPNPPEIPVALPSVLLERRPDIAAAERSVAAANANIGVARAAYYPNVTLSASAGLEATSFTQWFSWPSRFFSLGPQLAQTLYDGGARRAQNEQANAQYDSAVANYRQTVLTAFQGVEDNLATLRILSDEVQEQHTAVQSATRYLELASTRYKAGVDSYLNVITAQTSLLTNRETEVSIQERRMVASVLLTQALGGGWDPATLPNVKDMLAKPPAWTPPAPLNGAPAPVAAPSPAPLPENPVTNTPGPKP